MTFMTRTAIVAIVAGGIAFAAGSAGMAADEPENILMYRQNVMKSLGANIANLAMVAKGQVSFVGNTPINARAIRDGVSLIKGLFPDGSNVGKTNALPKLWDDRAGFEEDATKAAEAADAMVKAADSGDIGQIRQALGALGKTCGGCHKTYRKEL